MNRRRNLRLTLAAVFFSLCMAVSLVATPPAAEASNHCWMCASDFCYSNSFGFEECDAVPLESCTLSGNFCNF